MMCVLVRAERIPFNFYSGRRARFQTKAGDGAIVLRTLVELTKCGLGSVLSVLRRRVELS